MSDKQIRALVIEPSGKTTMPTFESRLENLQGLVGGYVQAIYFSDGHAYVNEDGHMLGMEFNEWGTRLAEEMGWLGGHLVGTVVFLGNSGSGEASVPHSTVSTAMRIGVPAPDFDTIEETS